MKPQTLYHRLNKLLWHGRLPQARIIMVDDSTLPTCHGLTLDDDDFALPCIFLNSDSNHQAKTLLHECLHVAEPTLAHGVLFDMLVERYWRWARKEIKGLK
jgi:hypothetical protein